MTWTCWDLRLIFYDFSQQALRVVRLTAVCSATFRRHLLLQLYNPYHTISAVTALQAAAQLEVACLSFVYPAVLVPGDSYRLSYFCRPSPAGSIAPSLASQSSHLSNAFFLLRAGEPFSLFILF